MSTSTSVSNRESPRSDPKAFLDNPVWHALRGPLSPLASQDACPAWLRFDPEVSVFGGVESIDDSTWRQIAAQAGEEGTCALFRDRVPQAPRGWEELFRGVCLQMIAGDLEPDLEGPLDSSVVELGAADAPEMLALADLTEPGPFLLRTRELGRYVGVRRGGRLIAMAGERFRVPGFVEISAVCTDPEERGGGLAAALTLNVARSIRARGEEAFLHVLNSNENAVRLYQKLGFSVRREVDVVFAQWHGEDWIPDESEV